MNGLEFWENFLSILLGGALTLLGVQLSDYLNRRRDDRLRKIKIKGNMVVLYSDLNYIFNVIVANYKNMKHDIDKQQLKRFYILLQSPILNSYHHMISDMPPKIASLIHAKYGKVKGLSKYLEMIQKNEIVSDDDYNEILNFMQTIIVSNDSDIFGELLEIYSLMIEYGCEKDQPEYDRLNCLSEQTKEGYAPMASGR